MDRREFVRSGLTTAAAALLKVVGPEGLLAQAREKARPLNLRVTDLKTFVVDAGGDENFVFVKIYTNRGLTGLGEGTFTVKEATVERAIWEHKRYLVGQDPTDIEFHWQGMFRGPRYRGGALLMSALSAVEIALWDILGQALGQPVWKLLGGKARDRIRMYPHAGGKTPQQSAASFLQRKRDGWTAAKSGFLNPDDGNVIDPAIAVPEALERLHEVRAAVGPRFDILIDLHGKATTPMAVEFCRGAERYRPMFIEEATQLEDLGELALLRSKTSAPLATGERHVTKYAFSEMCARHLVDYVQPDVVHCGGILEMVKIAAIADAFRIQLAPHNPQSEVSTVASMHVMAVAPNAAILEIGSGQKPVWKDLFHGGLVEFRDGYADLPDRPGLGLELDEKVAAKFPYSPKHWRSHRFPDGSISDR
ncbi:MAG: galactonate dehydratase [Bryobacteraceae bacterium]